jgi:hypothetical protein
MRGGHIGRGAELVEIAATAERATVPTQDHPGDRVVVLGDRKCIDDAVPHLPGEGIVALGAVQGDGQDVAGAIEQDRFCAVRYGTPWRGATPIREFRTGEQHGVGQGLGNQTVLDVGPSGEIEQAGECD